MSRKLLLSFVFLLRAVTFGLGGLRGRLTRRWKAEILYFSKMLARAPEISGDQKSRFSRILPFLARGIKNWRAGVRAGRVRTRAPSVALRTRGRRDRRKEPANVPSRSPRARRGSSRRVFLRDVSTAKTHFVPLHACGGRACA